MKEDEVLVELRFDSDARDTLDTSIASLKELDIEVSDTARDPTIVAALTVVAAATTLIIELIKLAKELRAKGKKQKILLVKLDENNEEKSIYLLEASEVEIEQFVSGSNSKFKN
jgi:hypothetical protein